jgi:hypothetical protein
MTFFRMIVLFSASAALMLIVIGLRAEITRLHYRASLVDRECVELRDRLREEELELQRLRNPLVLYQRALELEKKAQESRAAESAERPMRPARRGREGR